MCIDFATCIQIIYNEKHNSFVWFTFITNTQQTQNICIPFVQRWTNVEDVGPTLYKCYTNILCLPVHWEATRLRFDDEPDAGSTSHFQPSY